MRNAKAVITGILCLLTWINPSAQDLGKVAITPYVENISGEGANSRADDILLNTLKRVILANGIADNGLDSRFIITAHPVINDQETTTGIPPQTIVDFTLTFYVGDALDGKLYGAYGVDLRGVGNDLDDALASGYKKFKPQRHQELSAMISSAKARIMEYYNSNSQALLTKAKAEAASGNYAQCYDILLQIPEGCSSYQQAQDMLVEYRSNELDSENRSLLAKARATYSASPNEDGAEKARRIMAQINFPSAAVQSGMTALSKEMASHLKAIDDANRAAEARAQANAHSERMAVINNAAKAQANAHSERMAVINGATKVAVARASRPVYHIHRWGWW